MSHEGLHVPLLMAPNVGFVAIATKQVPLAICLWRPSRLAGDHRLALTEQQDGGDAAWLQPLLRA
jgi:hypothetical protein